MKVQFFYDKPRLPGVFYPPVSEDGKTYIGDAFILDANQSRIYLKNGDWLEINEDGKSSVIHTHKPRRWLTITGEKGNYGKHELLPI